MIHHHVHHHHIHHRHHHHGNREVNLTIDGIAVTVPEGTRILEAAEKAGVHIPTLCDHPALGKRSICRVCVVEADGRTRLFAACANEVWEGAKIVTNNHRLLLIRKTIIDLLLADHPQECLKCVRSGKCELQTLAGIYSPLDQLPIQYNETAERHAPETVNDILVRDMDKCIKCGRCVEACQELMGVRAINTANRSAAYEVCTPYREALSEGPCIYCGHCVELCPTGALYECDQTAQAEVALGDKQQRVVTQIAAALGPAMDKEFKLPPGTITGGKLASALKQLGFDKVYAAETFADKVINESINELLQRMKDKTASSKSKLPMIVSCSPSWVNYVKTFYPDLLGHISNNTSPEQAFGSLIKKQHQGEAVSADSKIVYVSVMHCISKKLESHNSDNVDIALTARELAKIIRNAGIDLGSLPEIPFDTLNAECVSASSPLVNTIGNSIYGAYTDETHIPHDFKETHVWTSEAEIELQGQQMKVIQVYGFSNARIVMDSIRKGECDAALVLVMGCPSCMTA